MMSTSFTRSAARSTAESAAGQPLGLLLLNAHQWVNLGVLHLMSRRGHADLTPAHIAFLANLDCGETHASAIARRMGISRQAVYRTTRELQKLRILSLVDDPLKGNQKMVRMSPHGAQVVRDARACLAQVENTLRQRIGERDCERLLAILKKPWGPVLAE